MPNHKFSARSRSTYKTTRFSVLPESVDKCQAAIREFVAWVKSNEPGTRWYISLQDQRDSTQFLHVMIFEDKAAEERHRTSQATRRFVEVLYPELAEPAQFTDCNVIASA